jgi:hypothetical protein
MGLFDFLSGGSDPQKQIDKVKRRLMDQYRQSHDRYDAMDELARIKTPASLQALLDRFTLRISGPTVDEQEKEYCYTLVAKWGPEAIEPLQTFIATRDVIYFPLRALGEVAGEDAAVDALLKAMADCNPGYHEGLERLREIVSNLRDFRHDRVRQALISLLASNNSEIRFFALDGLTAYPGEVVAPEVAARMMDPNESQRVKALAFELAVEHQWPLTPWAEAIRPVLPASYQFDAAGLLQRRS